jgi:hypothetical protein
MPFKKGDKKIEGTGRTKGTPNKKTKEVKERIEWVLTLLEETLEHDIKKLSPSQKTLMWKDLQEYVRPKLARTTMQHEGEVTIKQVTGMEVK